MRLQAQSHLSQYHTLQREDLVFPYKIFSTLLAYTSEINQSRHDETHGMHNGAHEPGGRFANRDGLGGLLLGIFIFVVYKCINSL